MGLPQRASSVTSRLRMLPPGCAAGCRLRGWKQEEGSQRARGFRRIDVLEVRQLSLSRLTLSQYRGPARLEAVATPALCVEEGPLSSLLVEEPAGALLFEVDLCEAVGEIALEVFSESAS